MKMNKKHFIKYVWADIKASIPMNDKPMLRKAWNDTIDSMVRSGQLHKRALSWSHLSYFYNKEWK